MARTRLVVGRVRGLHGLQGAVRIEVLTDRPEARFADGEVLHVEGDARPLTILAAQPVEDGPGWRVRFREIPNRQSAEGLRETYLEVEVEPEAELDPGAAYWHEVIGSTVRDSTGAELGKVADVYRAGEAEVYVVRGGPPGEFDLPAVRDVVTTFAPDRHELIVDEGVLDLTGRVVDAPVKSGKPRRRPRWSRHGKGARPALGADPRPGPESPERADPGRGPADGSANGGEPA